MVIVLARVWVAFQPHPWKSQCDLVLQISVRRFVFYASFYKDMGAVNIFLFFIVIMVKDDYLRRAAYKTEDSV